jgi:5'-nucleotidase
VLLNLNVPAVAVRGVKATRLGPRLYDDIVEMRTDPRGQQYLWIGGPSVRHEPSEGTDTAAYDEGFASLTPLTIDLVCDSRLPLAVELARNVPVPSRKGRANGTRANGGTKSRGASSRAPSTARAHARRSPT